MIELITGTPGAGKTTFAVAERVAKEAGRKIALPDETCLKLGMDIGTVVERRIVCAGVRGLKVEHDRLPHILTGDATPATDVAKFNAMVTERDPDTGKPIESDSPVHQRLPNTPPVDVLCIMQNWWLWCKPGDLIVIDEAQFVMPRGTLGRKPPYWLQAMEIHRHYGVDFLIITQHPQLIDTTVRALVGLHRHVRAVMGSGFCMVYVWDHASNPERYNNANKEKFIRRAKHYALFHSSVAHVKPPSSGRWGVVLAPLLLLAGLGGLGWRLTHLGDANAASKVAASAAPAATPGARPAPVMGGRPVGWEDVPELQGCYSVGEQCTCIGPGGRPVKIAKAMCMLSASSYDGLVEWKPREKLAESAQQYGAAAKPVSIF